MDTFDRVSCWTLTVGVVGVGCYYFATAPHIWPDGLVVGFLCIAGLVIIWRGFLRLRKIDAAAERDLFLAAAVRYFRALDASETGHSEEVYRERSHALMAWERYRQIVLEPPHRRSPR